MPKYLAMFHVEHGVSHGLGSMYPAESEERFEFEVEDANQAVLRMEDHARMLSGRYLLHPSGRTTVRLDLLLERGGAEIDVLRLVEASLTEDARKSDTWREFRENAFPGGKFTVGFTLIDRIKEHVAEKLRRKDDAVGAQ